MKCTWKQINDGKIDNEICIHKLSKKQLFNSMLMAISVASMKINISAISELKWNGMGEFNSDNHYIYYCGQESLRRNGVAIVVNKRVWNSVLACNLKNDRMISVRFQGKPFNITVTQVYALTSNAEEAEVERFYEDLQDLLQLTPKKMSFSL